MCWRALGRLLSGGMRLVVGIVREPKVKRLLDADRNWARVGGEPGSDYGDQHIHAVTDL